jgi:hypothetical protein
MASHVGKFIQDMDYIINSFYILYKRWIPAGDPKDEAVLVTSGVIFKLRISFISLREKLNHAYA